MRLNWKAYVRAVIDGAAVLIGTPLIVPLLLLLPLVSYLDITPVKGVNILTLLVAGVVIMVTELIVSKIPQLR